LPLPGEQTALLRVADKRIVEAWGVSTIGMLRSLVLAQVTNPSSGALVGMARVTYVPGAADPRGVVPGTLVVVAEGGLLVAQVDGTATLLPAGTGGSITSVSTTSEFELRPGDALIIPAFTWHAIRNDGASEATAQILGILPSSAASWSETGLPASLGSTTSSWPVSLSEGVTAVPLIGGTVDGAPTGSVRIALDRVTLEPGRGLEWQSRTGVMLLFVERGMASVDLDEGTARLIADASQATGRLRFGPDNGAALALSGLDQSAPLPVESTGNAIRNDGDQLLTFVVLTVLSEYAT
jgi:quercetin dioxygenase-like cupin family protein